MTESCPSTKSKIENGETPRTTGAFSWERTADHEPSGTGAFSMSRAMVQCLHLHKSHPGTGPILQNACLEIGKGEWAFLVGETGSGKTTLLRLLTGLEPVSRGQVIFAGKNLHRASPKERAAVRHAMGLVPQEPKLVSWQTVSQNIALPLYVSGKDNALIRERVQRLTTLLNLQPRKDVLCSRLSAGEKQVVSVARALAGDPLLLVADDPTAALGPLAVLNVLDVLKFFHARGTTILIATRDRTLAQQVPGSRVFALQGGEIVEE
ncbi:MAG TPA: ATP-binding cassette domain-containing protein [Syntrophobacteraceae bacterium]|nr:ATP-binding cassette domain-containing protein [Syntrophobacteraceae bacterium]